MDLTEKIRKYENLHIVFWLVKDTCWMLEVKWLGALMILPTLAIAVSIAYKSRQSRELLINLAIFCWISANSFWMLMEFFFNNNYKNYSAFPFALGFVFVGLYYWKVFNSRQGEDNSGMPETAKKIEKMP